MSRTASASYLLLHNRLVAAESSDRSALYGLSYDRRLLDRYGRFSEDLRADEDTEFNARFSADHPIVKARDVKTAHRYPTGGLAFFRDVFRRGRLQATMLGQIQGGAGARPRSFLVAARALFNVPHALRFALRAPEHERSAMLGAYPLVAIGGVVYAAGALAALPSPYEDE